MDSEKIGRLIALHRKQKHMTQQQLADVLGVTNKAVSKWETGEGIPDASNILVLSKALGISADELLSGKLNSPVISQQNEDLGLEAIVKGGSEFIEKNKHSIGFAAVGACIGAVLGILAYNYNWLG